MSEEEIIDEITENTLEVTMEAINVAMAIGDYKKTNELLDILTSKKNKKNKMLEDNMIA